MQKLLKLILSLLIGNIGLSQEVDSILYIRNSAFFTRLIDTKSAIHPLRASEFAFIKPHANWLKARKYQFFKVEKQLYIHFIGSGLLYQLQNPLDSTLTFKRIDDTEDYNYNIDAFLFTNKKDIYNLGGYGFWKTNGILRKYNNKDQEWDAVPTNQEIHIPFLSQQTIAGQISWFNPTTQFLYIPYQRIINSGLENEKDVIDQNTYRLNLTKRKWENLGKTSDAFYNILNKTRWSLVTETGLLICLDQKVYQINFEENSIKEISDPSIEQSLSRINNDYLLYYQNQTVYSLNGKTWKYDSVLVSTNKFVKANFSIWQKNNQVVLLLIPIVLLAVALTIRKSKNNKNAISVKEIHSKDNGTLKSTTPNINFNETEKQLLKILLNKTKQDTTTTINEINYILGIKDKNVGLQKKVRSDVINNINEKFGFLHLTNKPLIRSTRSNNDKRYFEYFIESDHLDKLSELIEPDIINA